MPNLTQTAYSRNLEMTRQMGFRDGIESGKKEAYAEIRHERNREIISMLHEAAALAQANAKLTYSLHMLIEKAAKNG